MDNFWRNAFGQLHYWWQAIGITIVCAVGLYVAGNADWTGRGIIAIVLGAITAYLTRDDHKKTETVAKEKDAEIETITHGELK